MRKISILFIAVAIMPLVGCGGTHTAVSEEQATEALKWATEYPELAPAIQDATTEGGKLDENEFKTFKGEYHTLVQQDNMNSLNSKLNKIVEKDLQSKYEALAKKTKEEAAAKGLVIRDGPNGIEVVKEEPATQLPTQLVITEEVLSEPVIDPAEINRALKNIIVEEK